MPFNHFDFISPVYDRLGRFDTTHPLMQLLKLPDNGVILDIGGGTGRIAQALTGNQRLVIVVDLSFGMLSKIHGKSGILAVMADSAALPFQTGLAARVLIVDALHHINRQRETISELCRVLEPGGAGVVVEPDPHNIVVKLIRLVEFLALFGSHFLKPVELLALFKDLPGTTVLSAWRGNLLVKFIKINKKPGDEAGFGLLEPIPFDE